MSYGVVHSVGLGEGHLLVLAVDRRRRGEHEIGDLVIARHVQHDQRTFDCRVACRVSCRVACRECQTTSIVFGERVPWRLEWM